MRQNGLEKVFWRIRRFDVMVGQEFDWLVDIVFVDIVHAFASEKIVKIWGRLERFRENSNFYEAN